MDPRDNEGKTPLHLASEEGCEDGMYYLQPHTKAINWQDYQGKTPLHLAVYQVMYSNNLRPIKDLLILGSDRTIKNKWGKTPLECIPRDTDENSKAELERILKK